MTHTPPPPPSFPASVPCARPGWLLSVRPSLAGLSALTVFLLSRRYESFHSFLGQVLQIFIRAIPVVGQNSCRFLSGLFFDRLHQRHHRLFVVGRLRHPLPYDQLKDRLDRDLRVVALHKSIRPLPHPRLGIGKVVLRLLCRLGFLPILPLVLGLLPCSLFQSVLGFPS